MFPKNGLGTCTWINKVHSSSWLYSCSTRGTDIAGVEGWWLVNRLDRSVPETQMTASRLVCALLIYFLPTKSMRDHCDIILWHHDHLLYSFSRKTTVHAQMKCHHSSVHLLASMLKSLVTIATPKPYCLFLILNFMPVTLSPRYFGAPSYSSLKFIYNIYSICNN